MTTERLKEFVILANILNYSKAAEKLFISQPVLSRHIKELEEYFSGKRRVFDLPVCPKGTEFQKKVWEALRAIPYGETQSYGEIAEALGGKRFSRAVGAANRKNPILILIPCHRVIGANGALTGFAAGLDLKAALLKLEKRGTEEICR
jgi:methylated-DNA-[protein]-cysteine S-methyltransferase